MQSFSDTKLFKLHSAASACRGYQLEQLEQPILGYLVAVHLSYASSHRPRALVTSSTQSFRLRPHPASMFAAEK